MIIKPVKIVRSGAFPPQASSSLLPFAYTVAAMKWTIVTIYVLSILHIHFRGRVRLPFFRQIFDHSSFVSPLNTFMHLFSGVPATPYLPTARFPELLPLQQNWQMIRAEALNLIELQKIS